MTLYQCSLYVNVCVSACVCVAGLGWRLQEQPWSNWRGPHLWGTEKERHRVSNGRPGCVVSHPQTTEGERKEIHLLIEKWTELQGVTFWLPPLFIPTLWKTLVVSIFVESTVGKFISAPSVLILNITQPHKLYFFFHSYFHFRAEQTDLSFLSIFPSFVHQCNCALSRNRKELPQSVKELLVKASFRDRFKHSRVSVVKFVVSFSPQFCHPSYFF